MGAPLLTAADMADWDAKKAAAGQGRDGDEIYHPASPTPYNKSASDRVSAVSAAWRVERLRRIRARPSDLLDGLLVAFSERGKDVLLLEDVFEGKLGERLAIADNPENRRHLHTILQGLRVVPRSWAKSATTRFFRGNGKQGDGAWATKPGAGVLSKDYGWTGFEAEWFISLFYNSLLAGVFFTDDSVDLSSAEAHEIEADGGNRFAATRKDRDDEFFDALIGVLEARGMAAGIEVPHRDPPKVRKPRVFKVGDVITASNLRDLPDGAIVEMSLVEYPSGAHWQKPAAAFEAEVHIYECVLAGRDKKSLYLRPIVSGIAFAPRPMSPGSLHRKGGTGRDEVQSVYKGQHTGPVIEAALDRDRGWVPTPGQKVWRIRDDTVATYPASFLPVDKPKGVPTPR